MYMKSLSKYKLLSIVIATELVVIMTFMALIIFKKNNSQLVSPPLSYWQSRFVIFEDGFRINEGEIDCSEFDNKSKSIDLLYGPYMILAKGGYTYSIEYECDYDQQCFVHAFERPDAVKDSIRKLKASKNTLKGHFSVNKNVDNLELRIEYNGLGNLFIKNITIVSGPYRLILLLARFVLFSVIFDALIMFWSNISSAVKLILNCITNRNANDNTCLNRYDGIDVLKCIASFMVVNVHMTFHGYAGDLILGISRAAVPVFFIISGFFYTNVVNQNKTGKQIKKVIMLIAASNLLYLVSYIIRNKSDLAEYLYSSFNYENIKKLILFNDSPVEYHLWYLNALLYVLIVYYFVWKINAEKYLIIISPLLLGLGMSLGKYSRIVWNKDISILYSRNFLLEGIPFFTIGILLYRLVTVAKLNNKIIVAGAVLSVVATAVEILLLKNKGSMFGDIYIATIFLSIFLVLLFVKLRFNDDWVKKIAFIGRKYSSNIYIIHVLIIDFWYMLSRVFGFNSVLYYFKSIIVFVVSLLLAVIFDRGIKRIVEK